MASSAATAAGVFGPESFFSSTSSAPAFQRPRPAPLVDGDRVAAIFDPRSELAAMVAEALVEPFRARQEGGHAKRADRVPHTDIADDQPARFALHIILHPRAAPILLVLVDIDSG